MLLAHTSKKALQFIKEAKVADKQYFQNNISSYDHIDIIYGVLLKHYIKLNAWTSNGKRKQQQQQI